ncbi:undecaprenyl-diphosphatase [Rhizobium sp. CFBP 8762]|uniref:undecaprenyl-diphosphatase n=1 Tax=Rhizobium sp. CFBP 8762 TaxID=2775279 RepID=UPI00177C2E2F|nr:undecaprenyl-diphosphatase [Rhizobium sp. CFBP 8762]MBD8553933.1 undecaprenyl-diphosphatase [Rhizobium sp. CFBP 8762]
MAFLDFDTTLFLWMTGGPNAAIWLVIIAILIAKAPIYFLPLHMVNLWFSGSPKLKQTALALFLALLIGTVLSYALGVVAYRPRPFVAGLGAALMDHRQSPSFPSNHALVFATYATTLLLLRRRQLGLLVASGGVVVGWSRIYLGVHYPLDIVGGAALGVVSSVASLWIMGRYGRTLYHHVDRVYIRTIDTMMTILSFGRDGSRGRR